VTKEQIIILAFIAAAFVAGWLARALLAWRERASTAEGRSGSFDPSSERALEDRGRELEEAVRAYQAAVASVLSSSAVGPQPLHDEVPEDARRRRLVDDVSDALEGDAANDSMANAIPVNGEISASEMELDLADWGFTYGVAWARARELWPNAADQAVAHEALRAAATVFLAYTGGTAWQPGADGGGRGYRRPAPPPWAPTSAGGRGPGSGSTGS
jgi:hypothetical protein